MTLKSRRRVAELAVIEAARVLCDTNRPIDDTPEFVALDGAMYELCQLGLETPTGVPQGRQETSQEAAQYMAGYVSKPLGIIWQQIRSKHNLGAVGLTCDQVMQYTKIEHSTASARINQLRDTGWIRDSGEKRITRAGRKAIVWTPTEFGLAAHLLVPDWGWTKGSP